MKELEVFSIPLQRQEYDAYVHGEWARVWCRAHRGLWLPAMDRAALVGNYGLVGCCPAILALLAPAQMQQVARSRYSVLV